MLQHRQLDLCKSKDEKENEIMYLCKDEGGFVVSYPDLPGCITCGETLESAIENAQDAKKAWIEAVK